MHGLINPICSRYLIILDETPLTLLAPPDPGLGVTPTWRSSA